MLVDRLIDHILIYQQGLVRRRTRALGPILIPMRKRKSPRHRWKDFSRLKIVHLRTIVSAFCCLVRIDASRTRTLGVAFLLGEDGDISAHISLFKVWCWTRGRIITDPLLLPKWRNESVHVSHETKSVFVQELTDKVNTLGPFVTNPPPSVSPFGRTRTLRSLISCNARNAARPGCISVHRKS